MGRHQARASDDSRRPHPPGRELTAADPRPRAVLVALDLDGTLLDARPRQVGVAAEAFAELAGGARLDEARFWALKREGATTRDALLAMGVEAGLAAAVARRWGEGIESETWVARDRALAGAAGALGDLRAAAIRVTVITARRSPAGARRSLAAAGLAELVDALVVVDPRDAVAAKAAELRARCPAHFVGDTESDAAAAAAAGVPFTAVSTGQRSAGYLRARGCVVASSLAEALARVRILQLPSAVPAFRA